VSEPFCDYVGVTVPSDAWEGLRVEVSAELDAIGMSVEVDQERQVLWRSADTFGTVKASRVGGVWSFGCSGSVCAGLRAAGRFMAMLAAIGARPHRVTRLDASLDLQVDAAPIVDAVAQAGRNGDLALTRKRIKPQQVETHIGVRADGALSGTVYLGSRHADVRMVVYDKQHERACRKLPNIGPQTRYELRLRSGVGVTLRDVASPAAVFWHHVAPDFLPLPDGAPTWAPEGQGFELERVAPLLPSQRLLRRLEASADVRALLSLASECGPFGVELLVSRIRAMGGGAGVSPAAAACAAASANPLPVVAARSSDLEARPRAC
jgi:hypothetical protein